MAREMDTHDLKPEAFAVNLFKDRKAYWSDFNLMSDTLDAFTAYHNAVVEACAKVVLEGKQMKGEAFWVASEAEQAILALRVKEGG